MRQVWQKSCDLSKLVFLDDTSASTGMIRRYGRAVGGQRCVDTAPAGHWQILTFIAGGPAHGALVLESGYEWRRVQSVFKLPIRAKLEAWRSRHLR
jgi:hypothetical protein